MKVDMNDVTTVLFARNLAYVQGARIDPDGTHTARLWEAALPISVPEPDDPPTRGELAGAREVERGLCSIGQSAVRASTDPR